MIRRLNNRSPFVGGVLIVLAVLSFNPRTAVAQARQELPLVVWDFAAEDAPAGAAPSNPNPSAATLTPPVGAVWKAVRAPHIFRQSGLPDNSAGWYRQSFTLSSADRGRRIFLRLEGAASVKDVFVNGQHVGQHKGAYTAAVFDLTPAVKIGSNQLFVRVSNRDREVTNMLARSTLYHVNGGMFREAWLVKTGAVHIFPDMGSTGVYLTPANVTADRADLVVRTVVRNPLAAPAAVLARHLVTDPAGNVAARFETSATVEAGQTTTLSATGVVARPMLWDIRRPELYTVRTELRVGGRLTDVVTERTGFRAITFKDNRFFLNGREVQFRGVNKHEQSEYLWNAVGDEEPRREWQWMDDMGVNMVRLAHYPHSHLEYDLADEKGLAVWAENGLAGQAWDKSGTQDKTPTPDGERLTREMVRQNWNHPSILFWSCGNESVPDPASRYAAVIREEDTTRLVTYASEGSKPKNVDFIAMNTYDGWYGAGHYTGFSQMPRNAFVSETGSGEWITHHVPYGVVSWSVDKYEPAEYSELFTEYRLQTVFRDDVANRPMFLWWNFREFYDRKFKQNRNTKGIVTLAGMPKDIYFLFQSFMRPDNPVVHLNGRHHFLRQFAPDNGIKAFSNAARLELTLNGVSQLPRSNGDYRQPDSEIKGKDGTVTRVPGKQIANVFFWKAPLKEGRNVVEVSDGLGHSDHMVIYQKSPSRPLPAEPDALVQELRGSNPENQPVFIDRPVEAQGPVYSDVDGASDNTFDVLPRPVQGAAWIATRRLSDPTRRTDLSFRINAQTKGATVYVMFSTGSYPTITLKKPNEAVASAAANFSKSLAAAGFKNTGEQAIWRDQDLERTHAALWSRTLKAGETLTLPGETLDYVVMVKKTD
jgi:beta-galactosidase